MAGIFNKIFNRPTKKSILEEELERAYQRTTESKTEFGEIFDIEKQKKMSMFYHNNNKSVYGKPPLFNILNDGSYKNLLPKDFFPEVKKTDDGRIFLPTTTWCRRNGEQCGQGDTQFEWYITSLQNGIILKEFTSDYLELKPNYLLLKLINPKPFQSTIMVEGVYDLSSNMYHEYEADYDLVNSNIKSLATSTDDNLFWDDMKSKMETSSTCIVPASINMTPQFATLINKIKNNEIFINTPHN